MVFTVGKKKPVLGIIPYLGMQNRKKAGFEFF